MFPEIMVRLNIGTLLLLWLNVFFFKLVVNLGEGMLNVSLHTKNAPDSDLVLLFIAYKFFIASY